MECDHARQDLKKEAFDNWYAEYRNSQQWQEIRRKVLLRENYICQGCGRTATLAHHDTYAHVGEEFLFELIALCDPCHKRYHGRDKDGRQYKS